MGLLCTAKRNLATGKSPEGSAARTARKKRNVPLLFLLPEGEGQDEGEGGAHFKLSGPKIWMTNFPLTPALSL